ncbi:MAG: chloride channel protein, partial [Duncaniella sp.]|nr:chloride channel protein [Duncaniella sp.]
MPQAWKFYALPQPYSLFLIAAILGFCAGFGAFLLKAMIGWAVDEVQSNARDLRFHEVIFILPVIGILLTVAFQKYIVGRNIEHGTEHIKEHLIKRNYNISPNMMLYPLIASTLTLGFGGSAGSEGPIATTGAAIGSNIGRWLKMPPQLVGILIACGACAGIAGIFKAPLGGVLFALEVLKAELTTVMVIALVIAGLVAGLTATAFSGFTLDVPLTHPQYFDPSMSGWVILLGIFCGFYSLYYVEIGNLLRLLFGKVRSIWARGLVSGSIVGLCLLIFPALYGEGYGIMAKLIDGHFEPIVNGSLVYDGDFPSILTVALVCGGIALLKTAASYSSNSGGGVAGDFAPTLFAGCMAGFFFAGILNHLFGTDI